MKTEVSDWFAQVHRLIDLNSFQLDTALIKRRLNSMLIERYVSAGVKRL